MDALHYQLLLILSLLFIILVLSVISSKLNISFPVFLVIGGMIISEMPHVPHVAIDPELIFLIFLPPLLYDAAWNTSWYHFWQHKRTVGLLAFGLVIFTAAIVAALANAWIPGFTLALGFLLGGIISPTDAVSATSVLKDGIIPKRAKTILEGESLMNDAASLIIFRFALAAVLTGSYGINLIVGDFFYTTFVGIAIGLIIAFCFYKLHRILPDIAGINASLTLMVPYIMYVSAEYFDCSGVMAVVSGGLFLSSRSHKYLRYDSRIQTHSVWQTITFLLNGSVFILIGLQLPLVINSLGDGYSVQQALLYSLVITLVVILLRIAWVYAAIFIPRMMSKSVRSKENSPGWKTAFLISWAGMRGVVSLASALSLPLALEGGAAFPNRNLILFISFVVILSTLILQGLTLPVLVRKLRIKDLDMLKTEKEQDSYIRSCLAAVINSGFKGERADHYLFVHIKEENDQILAAEIISLQRKVLIGLRKDTTLNHDLIRQHERRLDYEEARINSYYHEET